MHNNIKAGIHTGIQPEADSVASTKVVIMPACALSPDGNDGLPGNPMSHLRGVCNCPGR